MIPGELISALRKAFEDFITPFKYAPYNSDSTIEKRLVHTNRVVENVLILAESLELSENDKYIAEITAQFHDVGRFWLLLPENAESKITDHAEASIEYLKTSPIFSQLDEATQNIVLQVIINHNKPELPKKEGEAILFYTKLLRDADKLDSWRSTSEYITRKGGKPNMAIDLALSEKPIVTPSFSKTIVEGGIPNRADILTFNDFLLFQMSWIFDLHFKKSFQILNQKQYIRHLYDSLPKNDSVIEIYRMIRIYVENQI
ncbi:MAG TPA: HD domain-containing protein [Prolixibacteraceae bacterium]|jgi:HD superfamily phosphohydrolase YqeK